MRPASMAEHEKEPERASVGLKKAREDRGWSQAELAKRAKADVKTVRRWENGKSTPYEYECTELGGAVEMTLEEIKVLLAESRVHLLQKQSQVHPPYRLWMIDHWRTPYFTGRDELLERLHILLQTESSILLTHAITGLGVVGKTMLAVEYAYRYYQDFRVFNVGVWAQARSSGDHFAAFRASAKAPDPPFKKEH